ncbi:hypothetical protein LZZ85_03315 [Terrimonas sp. NA20]|uniref:Uncharacterized protein n=1 Tax=Terrimonas ginsenosidimutans TaxID=2908004 RepID=A0ABS9KLS7_9BACT|nr:hypothetical protein [Terrimonas ginsenosidimutans]MCG2613288.1 hypothetical protein [Terrimonas ginsenosidimutans]
MKSYENIPASTLLLFLTLATMTGFNQLRKGTLMFDSLAAIKEIDIQSGLFAEALRNSDSVKAGNCYTKDTRIFNSVRTTTEGREHVIHFYGYMIRNSVDFHLSHRHTN